MTEVEPLSLDVCYCDHRRAEHLHEGVLWTGSCRRSDCACLRFRMTNSNSPLLGSASASALPNADVDADADAEDDDPIDYHELARVCREAADTIERETRWNTPLRVTRRILISKLRSAADRLSDRSLTREEH